MELLLSSPGGGRRDWKAVWGAQAHLCDPDPGAFPSGSSAASSPIRLPLHTQHGFSLKVSTEFSPPSLKFDKGCAERMTDLEPQEQDWSWTLESPDSQTRALSAAATVLRVEAGLNPVPPGWKCCHS